MGFASGVHSRIRGGRGALPGSDHFRGLAEPQPRLRHRARPHLLKTTAKTTRVAGGLCFVKLTGSLLFDQARPDEGHLPYSRVLAVGRVALEAQPGCRAFSIRSKEIGVTGTPLDRDLYRLRVGTPGAVPAIIRADVAAGHVVEAAIAQSVRARSVSASS